MTIVIRFDHWSTAPSNCVNQVLADRVPAAA